MATLPILQNGDEILREIALPVPKELFGTPELKKIIADMADTLDGQSDGVAIAAPQVGISYRIFLVRYDRTLPTPENGEPEHPVDVRVFINPKFIKSSRRRSEVDEGCLSVRGLYGTTLRNDRATVRAQDIDGKVFERGGGGLLAQIFQHEIDHLDGILFIDHAVDVVDVAEMKKQRAAARAGEEHTEASFVFFGTPYVSCDTLEILKTRGYFPALVVTSPDSQRGRGMTLTPTETKEWALANDIPVLTPEKISDEVISEINSYGASYALVAAYGKLLPESLIDSFPLGILNIHYSLLPKYRGASPVEAALLNGDAVTGVAIQKMVLELDAGDIVALKEVAIEPTETTRELRPRLVTIGANLLADILPDFESGNITPTPQDSSLATRCKKIKKESGLLDLFGDAQKNWNKYRAYAESPGTYFFVQKGDKQIRIKLVTASYANGVFTAEKVIPEGKSELLFTDYMRNNSITLPSNPA